MLKIIGKYQDEEVVPLDQFKRIEVGRTKEQLKRAGVFLPDSRC